MNENEPVKKKKWIKPEMTTTKLFSSSEDIGVRDLCAEKKRKKNRTEKTVSASLPEKKKTIKKLDALYVASKQYGRDHPDG